MFGFKDLFKFLGENEVVQSTIHDVLSVVRMRGERVFLVLHCVVTALVDIEHLLPIERDIFGPAPRDFVNLVQRLCGRTGLGDRHNFPEISFLWC